MNDFLNFKGKKKERVRTYALEYSKNGQKVSLNWLLSDGFCQWFKEMRKIWYLLRCQKEDEADYRQRCDDLVETETLQEVHCFQYQKMMRYRGEWHLERRTLLPGYIFLLGRERLTLNKGKAISLCPCEPPFMRELCQEGSLIGMSRGVLKDGAPTITSGPLKGREGLIRRIDRHKRTAEIEIPVDGKRQRVTVGLEIYEKLMSPR